MCVVTYLSTQSSFFSTEFLIHDSGYTMNDSTNVLYKFIIGGDDRSGIHQKNATQLGLVYSF